MVQDWHELTFESRNYIHQRFMEYGIDGQKAFYDENLFPDEVRGLESEEIVELLRNKDISHVLPQSYFPDLANDINNIVLEDSSINRARGAEIMSEDEIKIANNDYINDVDEFEESLELFEDLPEILVGSTAIGLGLTAYSAYNKIKKNEIQFNEVPRYMIVETGGKIIRCAVIGICLKSGSIILVSATVGYFIYKSRYLLVKALNVSWNVLTHPVSLKVYAISGVVTLSIISGSLKVVSATGSTLWNVATHDTTKSIVVESTKITGNIVASTAKGVWNVATHETTKDIAIGTVNLTGKVLSNTAKGVWNVATHETTKDIAKGTAIVTGKILTTTAKSLWCLSKKTFKKK